jgi:hypothetical protein
MRRSPPSGISILIVVRIKVVVHSQGLKQVKAMVRKIQHVRKELSPISGANKNFPHVSGSTYFAEETVTVRHAKRSQSRGKVTLEKRTGKRGTHMKVCQSLW